MQDVEENRLSAELFEIIVKLTKNIADYAVNNPQKKIGLLVGAKAGDQKQIICLK